MSEPATKERRAIDQDAVPLQTVELSQMVRKTLTYSPALYTVSQYYTSRHHLTHYVYEQHKTDVMVRAVPFSEGVPFRTSIESMLNHPTKSGVGLVYLSIQTAAVFVAILTLLTQSHPLFSDTLFSEFGPFWFKIETIVIAVFAVDVVARLYKSRSPLVYCKSFQNLTDIVSLAPFFIGFVLPNADSTQVLGVLRILRSSKLLRYFREIDALTIAITSSFRSLLSLLFLFLFGVLFWSAFMYQVEGGNYDDVTGRFLMPNCTCLEKFPLANGTQCPKIPSKFLSIPSTMWFATFMMTAVGYDVSGFGPVCQWGSLMSLLLTFTGLLLVAMPVAIVAKGFANTVEAKAVGAQAAKFQMAPERPKELAAASDTKTTKFLMRRHPRLYDHPLLAQLRATHKKLRLVPPIPEIQVQILDWLIRRQCGVCPTCMKELQPQHSAHARYILHCEGAHSLILLPREKILSLGSAPNADIRVNLPGVIAHHGAVAVRWLSHLSDPVVLVRSFVEGGITVGVAGHEVAVPILREGKVLYVGETITVHGTCGSSKSFVLGSEIRTGVEENMD